MQQGHGRDAGRKRRVPWSGNVLPSNGSLPWDSSIPNDDRPSVSRLSRGWSIPKLLNPQTTSDQTGLPVAFIGFDPLQVRRQQAVKRIAAKGLDRLFDLPAIAHQSTAVDGGSCVRRAD